MSKRKAFTLPELLIVIAIIALLISILLPVLWQVRRRALVLACPIAYVGEDKVVHLTDPYGKWDLAYPDARAAQSYQPWVQWSPSGQGIGVTVSTGPGSWAPAILDPMSARVRTYSQAHLSSFTGWCDSSTFLDGDGNGTFCLRDVDNGAIRWTLTVPGLRNHNVNLLPPNVTGGALHRKRVDSH